MKYKHKLVVRIGLLVLVGILFPYIYYMLNPLTLHVSYYILRLFSEATLLNSSIIIEGITLNFIDACSAGAAFLLLAILVLLTKALSFKKMLKMFVMGSVLIFLMNIVRIEFLILILTNYGLNLFDKIHMVFWRILSTIFVALVWIFMDKYFKLRTIPIYSDIKYLIKMIKN
ncbi:MAG: pacearchaeosortase [archaeon]